MESYMLRCGKLSGSGSALDVVRKAGGLHGTSKKLVARQEHYNSTQHSRVELKFLQRDVGGTNNFIGDLEFKGQ